MNIDVSDPLGDMALQMYGQQQAPEFVDDYDLDAGLALDARTGKPAFKRAAPGVIAYDGRGFEVESNELARYGSE